jgi:hypothetical protein
MEPSTEIKFFIKISELLEKKKRERKKSVFKRSKKKTENNKQIMFECW